MFSRSDALQCGSAKKEAIAGAIAFAFKTELEIEMQRHLYLPWAADGMRHDAQSGGKTVERVALSSSGTAAGQYGLAGYRERVVERVLRNLVTRDVEACGIGQVVHIERELEVEALRDFCLLH